MATARTRYFRLPNDVRYGFAQIRRNPGLAAIIILSLALGIGANTAIFSVVNAMLLRELPVAEPQRLFAFQYAEPEGERHPQLDHSHSGRGSRDSAGNRVSLSISWPSYTYLRANVRLSELAGFAPLGMLDRPTAVVHGQPAFVDADMATSALFPALGIKPVAGRGILASDERPDAPRVAVISHRFWTREFGSNPSAVGETIHLNAIPATVVGIAPASFDGIETGRSPDVWIQMGPRAGLIPWGGAAKESPETVYSAADNWWLQVVVRPKPGVAIEQARAELDRLFRQSLLAAATSPVPPEKLPSVRLTDAARALSIVSRQFTRPLSVLTVVVALVLLVACANVATLLLARATVRRKEMAVRLALGAPRVRLVLQLLTESFLYAAAGAVLGVLFARWGGPALLLLLGTGLGPVPMTLDLDVRVLGFTALVALGTTLLFGLAPALRATRLDLGSDLKEQAAAPSSGGTRGLRGGKLLVGAQVALSLPLVAGAGLFLRTLDQLGRQPLGFDPEKLLVFSLDPTKAGITGPRLLPAYERLQDRLSAVPGVRSVSASRLGLMTGWVSNDVLRLEGDPEKVNPRERAIHYNLVAPRFFETMGMPLVLGRSLDRRDVPGGPAVAVVNETLARRFFPGKNPIGRRFWIGRTREGQGKEIVGVVRDAKFDSVRNAVPPTLYLPHTQPTRPLGTMFFAVRVAGDPTAILHTVSKAVAEVTPGVPLGHVKTLAAQVDESLGPETMYARLFTFFGGVALLLACVGLYGTMAFALARRTREIGIRMALGAAGSRVLKASLAEALVMAVAGVALGTLLASAGARYVRSLLFEVTPFDVPTLAVTILLMVAVALAAGYVPARRASRLDPLKALREE